MTKILSLRMSSFLFLILLFPLISLKVNASPVRISYAVQATIKRPLIEILQIATDTENTCDQGCPYYVSNVARMKKIEWTNQKSFYLWERIRSGTSFIDDSENFRFLTYSLSKDCRSARIRSYYPRYQEIKRLAYRYGLPHQTILSSFNLQITFNLVGFENNVPLIHVVYRISVTSDSSLVSTFSKKVKKSMAKTASEIFSNYQYAPL